MYKILSDDDIQRLRKRPARARFVAAVIAGATLATGANLSAGVERPANQTLAVQPLMPAFVSTAPSRTLKLSSTLSLGQHSAD